MSAVCVDIIATRRYPVPLGRATQNPAQSLERFPDFDAILGDIERPERSFEVTGPHLEDADCLPQLALAFEISKEDDVGRQIAMPRLGELEVSGHVRHLVHHEHRHALARQVVDERSQLGERIGRLAAELLEAGNAVDHHHARVFGFDVLSDRPDEFAEGGGERRRVGVIDRERPLVDQFRDREIDRLTPRQEVALAASNW